jgi:hypothetical protein
MYFALPDEGAGPGEEVAAPLASVREDLYWKVSFDEPLDARTALVSEALL